MTQIISLEGDNLKYDEEGEDFEDDDCADDVDDDEAAASVGIDDAAGDAADLKMSGNGGEEEDATTIFDKIISREIPATILYEDDMCLAFKDVNPVAKVHFLVIPKQKRGLSQLSKANESHKAILGHLLITCANVAKE